MSQAETINVLNRLIGACKDGESGFHAAAEMVKNNELKTLFHSYAQQRAEFSAELQTEVRRLGGEPEEHGSMGGCLHRGWMSVKAAIISQDDAGIISECERAEDLAKKEYEDALKQHLPADVLAVVQRQYAGLREAHDRTRALEVASTARP